MSLSGEAWAIPKGSTVLVTGANGYLASHAVDQFLVLGFKVRGTVRSAASHQWLTQHLSRKYGQGRFELCEVSDLAAEGAFDEVIKGVSAVAHIASTTNFEYDPTKLIPKMEAFALNALKATYAEPSAKRFVFCSSSWAAQMPSVDKPGIVITEDTYDEDAVKVAWTGPPYLPERAFEVYTASKVAAEKATWKYHKEHRAERPDLVVNAVLPSLALGSSIDPVGQGLPSTAGLTLLLRDGEINAFHQRAHAQWYAHAQDVGRLHVAATIFDHVQDQRIFAYAEPVCWDVVLDIMRRLEPDREFIANFSGGQDPHTIEPRERAEALLRAMGQPGFIPLEDAIKDLLQGAKEAAEANKTGSG